MAEDIDLLLEQIRACRACIDSPRGKQLPHEPRPVAVLSTTARVIVCGQAPGTRVHASGRPFTDKSGQRLREWMGIGEDVFYDASRVAIIPMGFCFPGLDANGGDLPPRRECAQLWHARVFAAMPQASLILAVGQYAQKWHLGSLARPSLTQTVEHWREIAGTTAPQVIPLPHPSWRNTGWLKKHPWFAEELVPFLRERVAAAL
jgi:uracil-DNA glycosylase